uniref:Vacuolar protein sorting 13 homolog C n=1 Tax=Sphenodon punctatus TaxID=8508 RepID=A0A8D0H4F6_SPHPU
MVLESVVADLLNRFLGDYVENLNKSQLKLGIWGGKSWGRLELDVPFKVKAGQIDKLTLKIPWKNLYGEAVVATLEGLYLLIVPGATKCSEHWVTDVWWCFFFFFFSFLSLDKPKEEKKDTFLEKLATQVIKNVQVKITGIHVKYEDDTANENWTPCILNEAAKIIYKVIFFRPVSASAKLYINPHAETELKTPKLDWNMEVQNIAIELTKPQYLSMIDLLESIDYMVRNAPYRKYRPDVPLHKNAKQWWEYAANGILEVHIRRYTHMWSWSNIKHHRHLLRSYKKYTSRCVIRSGQKLLKKKSIDGEKKGGGWFSGFWGKKEPRKKEDEESTVPETIDDLMTPDEKTKLFTAIGYSESSRNLALPKKYVAHVMTLKLLSTSLTIREDKNVPETLQVQIIDLSTKISQRQGAQALRVEAKLAHWYVTGLRQQNAVPSLVASIGDKQSSLLKIEFETNPEDSTADQSLLVQSQPVEIIYDAKTINSMVEFFQTNKGMDLEQLTTATLMKLEEIKERTATGLTHIIETRKVLDLRIHLKPSYLVVPWTGFHHEKSDLLILDFGTFQLNSINQGSCQTSSSSLEEIMDKAYDKFDVEIKNVQLLFGRAGEDWKKARFQHTSTLHILQPMDMHVQLAKSMVEKDIRMAKFKVSGGLPLVHVRLSDQKIKAVFELIDSIPLHQKPTLSAPSTKVKEKKETCSVSYEDMVFTDNGLTLTQVVLELTKQQKKEETILVYNVTQLGTEAVVRTYDLKAVSYLKKISLDYYEIQGKKQPLHLISSSDKPGLDLLKVEYIKADKNGPKFQTTFDNTEQTLKVSKTFGTSLVLATKQKCVWHVFISLLDHIVHSVYGSGLEFIICCFTGLDSSLLLQSSQTSLFARLKDIIVTDVDSGTTHKKAVSIVGDEVFSFNLALYPDATEGEDYTDMSKVDGTISLKVGCIQIVYLHKFLMSLLNFLNNFQMAKEALSAATVQAAEKAATSVKDLAQRSFRLSMDIHLKAPVIVIPQSSVSQNAVVIDLGLIKIQNEFSLVSAEGSLLPPVIDKMNVQLTKLKMSRTVLKQPVISQPDIQLLHPINLNLSVNRNLAAAWYHKIPMIEIKGYLDTMNVSILFFAVPLNLAISGETKQMDIPITQNMIGAEDKLPGTAKVAVHEDVTNMLLNFEIKEVCVQKKGCPLHILTVLQLGTETRIKSHDMIATAYLKKIIMKCLEFTGKYICKVRSLCTLIMTFFCCFSACNAVAHDDVCDLKLVANLNAFNVLVCDQKCSIADIRVQGVDASIDMKTRQTEVFARLQDIIITNVDPNAIHQKAVSIVGDEVFRFRMSLYPDATEGDAYVDMSKVDGKMSLKVGCIQIVYLHKFFMTLLNFLNHFQKAKEALSEATAQAAEMAASSMKDFAKKSFRLLMDINLKAPVIIIPQSSVSHNVLLADLGLIRVHNEFSMVSTEESFHPPVIDKMDVQLTHLKLSRSTILAGSQPEMEILQPVNMLLSVQRNLAAAWYPQIPGIAIKGNLKPLQIALSEDDLTLLMKIILENLGEASSLSSATQQTIQEPQKIKKEKSQRDADLHEGNLFNQIDSLRLGELRLYLMTSSGKMFSDGSMDINTKLTTCTLDDLREDIPKATSRLILVDSYMIDIQYKQDKNGSKVVAILDKLYVCASVEFLLTVADFFIKSMPTASTEGSKRLQFKPTSSVKLKPEKDDSPRPNMKIKALIMDPEIVFVASLAKADAPALAASFQCSFSLATSKDAQRMTAQVRELKVLACPFLKEKQEKNITTIVQPCSLLMEAMTHDSGIQNVAVTVEQFVVKISPIILNTVMTIMSAVKPKAKEEESKGITNDTGNLWNVKSIHQCHTWFLGVDVATEATETYKDSEHSVKSENFDIAVKSVQITMECGSGHRTVPLLLVESTFLGAVKNWSSLMGATADMTLEVHYYNEMYAVWEPLIERVDRGRREWNLKLDVKTSPVQDKSLMPGDDFVAVPEPQTTINISSRDTMNITISKCSLAVFDNLAKGFSEGTASTFDYSFKDRAPFMVKNALGVPLKIHVSSNLHVVGSTSKEDIYDVDIGQNLELEYSVMEPLHRGKLSALYRQESCLFTLSLVPHGYTEVANIPIAKPGRRLHNVRNPLLDHSDSVLVQIDAVEGNKVIAIRSPLQIKNHFSIPFTIYKFVRDVRLLEPIGVSKPEEEFHVPLDSYRCQLFIQPAGILEGQYRESTTYIAWREELHRSSEVRCMLQCPSAEINFLPLIVITTAVPDQLNFIATHGEDWDPAYIIHLHPTLTVRNLLPYSLRYLLEGTADAHELPEGSTADVLHSRLSGEIMELVLIKYQGKNWNGHLKLHDGVPEFFPVCFTSNSTDMMTVDVYIHIRKVGSRMILSVYSPYWIINKTSRVLQYRAEDVHVKHAADYRDIILFSFKKKNIFSKNKIQLCISTSSWSSSFSLDTVGSYGCVKCPATYMDYLVGVSIKMSSFNLTRIITLTPFYTIANKSSLELEVGEIASDGSLPTTKWSYFSTSECLPFWPENLSGKLCVRVVGCERMSKPFFYNRQDNGTLLSLEELNTGIIVDVNISEHSTVINLSDYHEGAAPAMIINHTPWVALKYKQSGLLEDMELKPREVRLFAWADPTGLRKLTWTYAQNHGEHDLLKDECGQFPYNTNTQIHWVSFLDGRQRVLLFTDDVALVSKARQAEEMEQPDQEINLSLHSLGLSLVNNENKQEISYIGITSSGVVWELKPKQRWKPFNQKQISLLEQAYQKRLSVDSKEDFGWVKVDNNFEVNFSKMPMEMRLPIRCKIKRDFLSAIQIEFKQSPHQRSLRAQLYWLQVDNQLPGPMFPVVFHPVAPPKSIALDSEPKPFIDVSIITRFNEYSKVLQFKYFMVLIQEMALKIDQGFLGAVTELFTPSTDSETERQRTKLIQQDIDGLNTELLESSMTDMSTLSFFYLSLGSGREGSDKEKEEMIAIHSVNLLLKSIGATLTDVDDLIFKLAFFEIKYQFYRRDQLMWRVVRHYSEQFLNQMYVLVLGLDVLGNPFGLIRGLSEGVEAFFYEPFQGAVQGPEEFAEGFVIGVRSLLGHTVGGAAGVVSRITGSVGKGLAAITMDKEYQQKRREEMGRQPKDFGDSLAKGGKGLLRGVVGGVTGIITKPVEGAKKEGAAGFFKGIGKGLVGVVARPTGGIIDMASSTFQGIQRVAESTEDVCNLRPPRLIHEDGIIRPYDKVEAEGYDLFEVRVV